MSNESTRSGNSKRSLNSFSSNNSNKKSKKITTSSNQKTLGAAWGSHSLSSSRSSFRTSPFSDFGSYMAVKNKKLHDQFDAEASTSSRNTSGSSTLFFQGVSIFVDGFTIPSSQELRGYMMKHGGRMENYFSRRRVTHIICSNLPNSKIKNLRSFSRGLPVVKPTWVLDCVVAGKLLSWFPYQLDQVASEAHNQPKLSAFFASKSNSVSGDVSSESACLLKAEVEDSELRDGVLYDETTFNADESSECARQDEIEMKDAGSKQFDTTASLETALEDNKLCLLDKGKSVFTNDDLCHSPLKHSTSASNHDLHRKTMEASSSSPLGTPSYHRHSTMGDPNFVENYFKSSRLHFIGTWRNRYRKRVACLSSKINDSNCDAATTHSPCQATIIHVDMDCFFVAVVIRNRPDLMDKPVAVCHSDSARGTAEISSANYPARDYGVKAGMFVREAKARCPHLLIVPYNFEAYEEVADQFYDILHRHCNKVQAVSCDEAFLDVTALEVKDPELLASLIRKEIFETTGCTASAGIAGNVLMARLATRTAKPDGQCYIPSEKVDEYLLQLPIKVLPGIGRVLEEKLKSKGVQTCGELRKYSKESLQKDFGLKTGEMLWNYCRGVDNRLVGVIQESKSVGAEVNWGVRFKNNKDSEHFLSSLCKEVSLRLKGCDVQGRTFTLKIKKRREDAGEPAKFMGCGDCENLSHSTTVPVPTDDVDVLKRIAMQLFGYFRIDVKDIRGIGLQVTKLETAADSLKQGHERKTMRSWLASGTACNREQCSSRDTGQFNLELAGPSRNPTPSLPSMNDLDVDVIETLPSDLFYELNSIYGGKLNDLVSKRKSTIADNLGRTEVSGPDDVNGNVQKNDEPVCSNDRATGTEPSVAGIAHLTNFKGDSENVDLMPSSLSQVDVSVLQQLPEDLRADIVRVLPAHRRSSCLTDGSMSTEGLGVRLDEGQPGSKETAGENFWVGNPPYWVHKFEASSCLLMNILAEMFLRSGSTRLLSSALQFCLSRLQVLCDLTEDLDEEASSSLCDLFRQYIRLKLETDIEEIYVCFRLLKRMTKKFKAFLHVYDAVLPYLQASFGESYGGSLHLP